MKVPFVGSGRRRLAAVGLMGITLIAAACGSSSHSTSSNTSATTTASGSSATSAAGAAGTSASGSGQATGTPLNVMTLASVNYAGPNYANILDTATVAVDWINAHGGIQGHPLKLTNCDEQGDPTKTAQCGREAIADHDVAVIGSFTLNGSAIIPELQAANTSWFGICCAASPNELVSPVVQQIGSQDAAASAMMVKASIDGCKKTAFVTLNVGAAAQLGIDWAKNGVKSVNGPPIGPIVYLPVTAQDYSSEAAQAASGTDCIVADISEANWPPFVQALQAAGDHQRLYGPQGNLDSIVTTQFPQATQNAVVVEAYSDISLPAWANYRAALSEFHAPTKNIDYNSLGGLGTWTAYVAFQQIADAIQGPITNQTFLAAAEKAKVNLAGMTGVGSIDFSVPFTGLGPDFKNLPNLAMTFDVVKNGNLVPFDNGKFFDFSNAMTGQPLPAADQPPAGQAG
jgi:ABC-type branched-subunit amino acid transport system substrate-binding protein